MTPEQKRYLTLALMFWSLYFVAICYGLASHIRSSKCPLEEVPEPRIAARALI